MAATADGGGKGQQRRKGPSGKQFKVEAQNKLEDLQSVFDQLQQARRESRREDGARIEEQIGLMLREWQEQLRQPAEGLAQPGNSQSSDLSSEIERILQLHPKEEYDDATSPTLGVAGSRDPQERRDSVPTSFQLFYNGANSAQAVPAYSQTQHLNSRQFSGSQPPPGSSLQGPVPSLNPAKPSPSQASPSYPPFAWQPSPHTSPTREGGSFPPNLDTMQGASGQAILRRSPEPGGMNQGSWAYPTLQEASPQPASHGTDHALSQSPYPSDSPFASTPSVTPQDQPPAILWTPPSPSAYLGSKCALWDCSRPAEGDYCCEFHASVALAEGGKGKQPVMRPGGVAVTDHLLLEALQAKLRGKEVGLPVCERAATAQIPWEAPGLFNVRWAEGENMREWLFFDQPSLHGTGSRKQRTLPGYAGRGWHESRKLYFNDIGGLKRILYLDPQPEGEIEWHLYEYELAECGDWALHRLEMKKRDGAKAGGRAAKGVSSKDGGLGGRGSGGRRGAKLQMAPETPPLQAAPPLRDSSLAVRFTPEGGIEGANEAKPMIMATEPRTLEAALRESVPSTSQLPGQAELQAHQREASAQRRSEEQLAPPFTPGLPQGLSPAGVGQVPLLAGGAMKVEPGIEVEEVGYREGEKTPGEAAGQGEENLDDLASMKLDDAFLESLTGIDSREGEQWSVLYDHEPYLAYHDPSHPYMEPPLTIEDYLVQGNHSSSMQTLGGRPHEDGK